MRLLGLLGDITEQASANKESLVHSDKQQLEKKMEMIKNGLNVVGRDIKYLIEEISIDVEKELLRLKNQVEAEISNHLKITVGDFKTLESRVRTESRFILPDKKIQYDVNVTNHYAEVSDTCRNISEYIVAVNNLSRSILEKAIDGHIIEQKLKEIILSGFDMSDTSFDEREILGPLSLMVKKIKISYIEVDRESYIEEILEQFPNRVENEEIHKLKLIQTKLLGEVCSYIQKEIDAHLSEIKVELAYQANTFVDTLNKKITQNIEKIAKQIQNKEESLLRYDLLLAQLGEYKLQIKKMEM